jgi:hypothetical protein
MKPHPMHKRTGNKIRILFKVKILYQRKKILKSKTHAIIFGIRKNEYRIAHIKIEPETYTKKPFRK